MTTAIVKREIKYVVYHKKLHDDCPGQFTLGEKDGKILEAVLQHKDCPGFIPIKGKLWNRWEIRLVDPIMPKSAKAIAMQEAEARYYAEGEKIRLAKIEANRKKAENKLSE